MNLLIGIKNKKIPFFNNHYLIIKFEIVYRSVLCVLDQLFYLLMRISFYMHMIQSEEEYIDGLVFKKLSILS